MRGIHRWSLLVGKNRLGKLFMVVRSGKIDAAPLILPLF
jgi:hypothetical protein